MSSVRTVLFFFYNKNLQSKHKKITVVTKSFILSLEKLSKHSNLITSQLQQYSFRFKRSKQRLIIIFAKFSYSIDICPAPNESQGRARIVLLQSWVRVLDNLDGLLLSRWTPACTITMIHSAITIDIFYEASVICFILYHFFLEFSRISF